MFSPIFRSQVNYVVSDTNSIIERHIAKNDIIVIKIIIRKTTIESITQRKQY